MKGVLVTDGRGSERLDTWQYHKKAMAARDIGRLYDEDLYVWACRNAQLLREGRYAEADMANIAEEIESLGKEQVHGLRSQIRRLLLHLLKYQYQPERRTRSWRGSIVDARAEVESFLKDNPSLRSRLDDLMPDAYEVARKRAAAETGLPKKSFPTDCPYSFQQMMDDDFPPE
jgi:hypothetical protein